MAWRSLWFPRFGKFEVSEKWGYDCTVAWHGDLDHVTMLGSSRHVLSTLSASGENTGNAVISRFLSQTAHVSNKSRVVLIFFDCKVKFGSVMAGEGSITCPQNYQISTTISPTHLPIHDERTAFPHQ